MPNHTLQMQDDTYDAEVAGLHYRVFNSAVGLNLMLAGFSHKLPVLLRNQGACVLWSHFSIPEGSW